jgi:cobalt-zinc-cadmium efflux system outer membrane protein
MKIVVLLCFLAGSTPAVLGSNTNGPLNNLTLERVLEMVLRSHPHLAEAAANLEAARARAATAGRLPNPEIVGRMESAPLSSGTTSLAEYVAGFSQTIPLGKRLSAAREAERAGVDLREKEREAAAWNLIRSVRGAFATALFTSRVLQAQINLASNIEELLRITMARVDQGDAAPLDLARIEAEAAQQRLEVKESDHLHREAMHALSTTLGDFETPVESLAGNLEDVLEIAAIKSERYQITDNPNLAVMESAIEAQRAHVRLAKSERIPDVNLDLFYRRLQGTRENAFDVGVRIPIPVFDRKRGRLREAESELRAAEARMERSRNELGLELRSHELALERALETVSVLKTDVLPKVETSLRSAEARYAAGDTSLSDVLAVRREATAAQLQYLEALRAVMVAWSDLRNDGTFKNFR